ncbi:MAG: reverse transcriptase family protein, partial [Candidatus Thiodiazotropha sp.]
MDSIVNDISSLFLDSAQTAYGKKSRPYSDKNSTIKSNSQPWYGRECMEARKEFIKAKNRYSGCKTQVNKQNMKAKGKHYRRVNHIHYRRHINNNANKIKSLKFSNPKKFWRFITRKQKSNPDVDVDAFYQFMKNLNTSTTEDVNSFSGLNIDETLISEELNECISLDEIKTNALKLVNGKSSGLDSVLNEHIKSTLHLMLPIYHKLFNIVFDTGVIPSAWTEGCIIPIYKNKGNTKDPENYRPITLLSCFGKLFTAIINARLQTYAQEFDVIGENQTGFRKNYSTMDNVFALHILFDLMSKSKRKLHCAFIDFRKAFDTVWRIGLWRKLIDSQIRGKCFNIIYNLYQGIKSCVSVNGVKSPFFQCSIGVRQGENLSPFLFSIYLNDLENYLRINDVSGIDCTIHSDELFMFFKMFVLLYADDTVLLAESSDDLQHALNIFEKFCTEWKLTVNIDKTKIIVFGRGKSKSNLKFFYKQTQVEIVKQYKYLGVIISRGGSLAATIKHNCEQATKAMYVLIRKIRSLNLSIDLQLDLFDKMIKPILLYGCEVWG